MEPGIETSSPPDNDFHIQSDQVLFPSLCPTPESKLNVDSTALIKLRGIHDPNEGLLNSL